MKNWWNFIFKRWLILCNCFVFISRRYFFFFFATWKKKVFFAVLSGKKKSYLKKCRGKGNTPKLMLLERSQFVVFEKMCPKPFSLHVLGKRDPPTLNCQFPKNMKLKRYWAQIKCVYRKHNWHNCDFCALNSSFLPSVFENRLCSGFFFCSSISKMFKSFQKKTVKN